MSSAKQGNCGYQFLVFWYDSTRGLNPWSTVCEADTVPPRKLRSSCDLKSLGSLSPLVSIYRFFCTRSELSHQAFSTHKSSNTHRTFASTSRLQFPLFRCNRRNLQMSNVLKSGQIENLLCSATWSSTWDTTRLTPSCPAKSRIPCGRACVAITMNLCFHLLRLAMIENRIFNLLIRTSRIHYLLIKC